jgi:hypothetical protein
MLKTQTIELTTARDAGRVIQLTELSAFEADRAARAALLAIDEEPDGGVIALAFEHVRTVRAMGERGLTLLSAFVRGDVLAQGAAPRPFDIRRDIRDWRNVQRLQDAALLLHVGFMLSRKPLDVPVTFQAQSLLKGGDDLRATFCSPVLAAALQSGHCTYRELETVLSTEDAFNIVELVNINAIRSWQDTQTE